MTLDKKMYLALQQTMQYFESEIEMGHMDPDMLPKVYHEAKRLIQEYEEATIEAHILMGHTDWGKEGSY